MDVKLLTDSKYKRKRRGGGRVQTIILLTKYSGGLFCQDTNRLGMFHGQCVVLSRGISLDIDTFIYHRKKKKCIEDKGNLLYKGTGRDREEEGWGWHETNLGDYDI